MEIRRALVLHRLQLVNQEALLRLAAAPGPNTREGADLRRASDMIRLAFKALQRETVHDDRGAHGCVERAASILWGSDLPKDWTL